MPSNGKLKPAIIDPKMLTTIFVNQPESGALKDKTAIQSVDSGA
jgi:hypothetical protein